jgi:hypothetical protein
MCEKSRRAVLRGHDWWRVRGKVRLKLEAVERFDRETEVLWGFQVFLCLLKRVFSEERARRTKKARNGGTWSAVKGFVVVVLG